MNCRSVCLSNREEICTYSVKQDALVITWHHVVENTYKDTFIIFYHIVCVVIHAFAISYSTIMHIGSTKEITLLEFNEEEEGGQQEIPQVAAPKEEEQNPKELLECPDQRPTSFLKGKPRSILSLSMFYKYYLSPLCLIYQVIRVDWKHLMYGTTLSRYIHL